MPPGWSIHRMFDLLFQEYGLNLVVAPDIWQGPAHGGASVQRGLWLGAALPH